jgi:hypothetical protein
VVTGTWVFGGGDVVVTITTGVGVVTITMGTGVVIVIGVMGTTGVVVHTVTVLVVVFLTVVLHVGQAGCETAQMPLLQ